MSDSHKQNMISNIEPDKDYEAIYKEVFYPILAPYERLRLKALEEVKRKVNLELLMWVGVVVVATIIVTFPLWTYDIGIAISVLLGVIAGLGFASDQKTRRRIKSGVNRTENKKYQKLLKKYCFKQIVQAFENMEIVPDEDKKYIDLGFIRECNLIDKDGYLGAFKLDDVFVGEHKGVKYRIVEVKDYGVFVMFASNKPVFASTTIRSKGSYNISRTIQWLAMGMLAMVIYLWVVIYSYINATPPHAEMSHIIYGSVVLILLIMATVFVYKLRNRNKVSLEGLKNQYISSKNQVEARYQFTPAFIERYEKFFKSMQKKYDGIVTAFWREKVIIGFPSTNFADLFEIGDINLPMSDPKNLSDFYSTIEDCLSIIDYLKLDSEIGF